MQIILVSMQSVGIVEKIFFSLDNGFRLSDAQRVFIEKIVLCEKQNGSLWESDVVAPL